jgi:hypothetical protein
MATSGKSSALLVACLFLALAAVAIFWIQNRPGPMKENSPPTAPDSRQTTSSTRSAERAAGDDGNTSPAASPGEIATADPKISALILASLEQFSTNTDPEIARNILRSLREGIRSASEEEAAAAILAFLKTGQDSPTGLPFAVGPDGMMDTVPSLRLALLDLLPSLDPMAALAVARELMDKRTSPDEYALSLRNLAWNDLDGDMHQELTGRFLDLLKTPWMDQPTAGVLESFDIAVELGGKPIFDEVVSITSRKNPVLNKAAFISLDRMVLRDPSLLTAAFSDPNWMKEAPQQRASLLSRLDINQPAQRDLFVQYLSSTAHGEGELEYFAKIFPNANYLHGHRLVTSDDATPSIDEISAADAQVLAALDTLGPGMTGNAATTVEKIRQRLNRQKAK